MAELTNELKDHKSLSSSGFEPCSPFAIKQKEKLCKLFVIVPKSYIQSSLTDEHVSYLLFMLVTH